MMRKVIETRENAIPKDEKIYLTNEFYDMVIDNEDLLLRSFKVNRKCLEKHRLAEERHRHQTHVQQETGGEGSIHEALNNSTVLFRLIPNDR